MVHLVSGGPIGGDVKAEPAYRRWTRLGWAVLVAAVPATVTLAVPGETGMPGHSGTIYDAARWSLLAGLVVAGAALLLARRAGLARVAATVGAVMAAQLLGTGVVALKHWRPASGMAGIGQANLDVVLTLARVLIIAGVVALVACLLAMRLSGAFTGGASPGARVITVAVGFVVAAGVPPVLGAGNADTTDLTSLGAYALLYSLPWGVAIGSSGWLDRVGALAVAGAVAGSAVACLASHTMMWVSNPVAGFLPVVVLAGVVAALRTGGFLPRRAGASTSSG